MSWNRNTNTKPTAPLTAGSSDKDIQVPTADLGDTIQAVRWSPTSDHLAAASWDGKTRIYEVSRDGSSRAVAVLDAEAPVFSCDWSKDGTLVAAAGADKKIHVLQAASGETLSFAGHDAPIRDVRFVDIPGAAAPVIASGSWDTTVRYWDVRNTSQPIGQLQCNQRVYSMDTSGNMLVIATANNTFHLVDLAKPTVILRDEQSQLNHQIRAVCVMDKGKSWATGTIEGRSSLSVVDKMQAATRNFTWKCHRDLPEAKTFPKVIRIYAINAVASNPAMEHRIATGGSDGSFNFWDTQNKLRLKGFAKIGGSITACAFDRTGTWFAYAVGYDWAQGHTGNKVDYPTKLMLHRVEESDMKR